MQLDPAELSQIQRTLQDYEPSQSAIATLVDFDGDLDASLEELLRSQMGTATFQSKSLKQVTLQVLREQLCGNEGFRQKLGEYMKNKEITPLLTGLIVYLASKVVLPFPIDPALATIVVLYISKVSLEIFCRYTEPETKPSS
ncbi:hypothetical protein [Merismopedia glauca]|uniref:Uncharacterized protein n=1 Tax=Merismopedia glauca CCAP 1448/3 TaxID=1296344 RepID=A0A2T1C000_9CYAN|nr:hypothetical protein [Merismopedia glauca]PSB01488.1 hypothetical protein C7B64_18155 [Merismopedia glauca CCAP 1448/3]